LTPVSHKNPTSTPETYNAKDIPDTQNPSPEKAV
jgi:hypothetical protein